MTRIMVGRRKNNSLGLEPRVYLRRGKFYYVHRDGRWEPLGTDLAQANKRAKLYNDSLGNYGTLAYWLDMFIVDCEQRVAAGTLAQRTLDDYRTDVEPLKTFFESPFMPGDLEPTDVNDYLETGARAGRAVRANREKACLSSCVSWIIRNGHDNSLKVNPCLRASGVRRNTEKKRERYVTHDEYREVYALVPFQVRAMMDLTYRTLQRPESDILGWTVANVIKKDGQRVLRNAQKKVKGTTGNVVDIELVGDLAVLVDRLIGEVPRIGRPLIHASRGEHAGQGYTYDGLSAMLKRGIKKANEARKEAGREPMPSFGFRDLKGKGATDMWLNGTPIETIQHLCGHEDKATTETYVKQRWRENAQPNMLVIGA